jgi:GNAT superfamily N-acetyltransferase
VVERAEAELTARYGALGEEEQRLTVALFDPPSGSFVVARDHAGLVVGGVGVRALGAGAGEVRRLWVDPAWRGRGVGRALMAELEKAAGAIGLGALELGTGDRQPEAVALYSATGWERCRHGRDGALLSPRHVRFTKILEPSQKFGT